MEQTTPIAAMSIGRAMNFSASAAPIAAEIVRLSSLPVVVKPNAGLPRVEADRTVYDVGPDDFAAKVIVKRKDGSTTFGFVKTHP